MATQAQVKAFIDKIAPIAQKLCKTRKKWILPSVCIAQACCESAYGTSKAMVAANGLFGFKVGRGVKYGNAWKGKSYNTKTKEFYGQYVTITDNFRAYDTVEEAVEDYMDLLCTLSRYAAAANQKDPKTCITAIKNGGYATSPTYINTIISIIDKYNLTQYDNVVAGGANKAECYPIPNYSGSSIAVALTNIGVDSSYTFRKKIAQVNGISGYTGTASQNTNMLNLLMEGKLKKSY